MTDWCDGDARVLIGDVRARLAELPDESVQCVVTSPPYWGLRDYGAPAQLGLEATPEAFVCAMVEVFREVRRVLRSDGTLWLNLGDSYASNGGKGDTTSGFNERWPAGAWNRQGKQGGIHDQRPMRGRGDLKPKDLIGVPWRLALALQADGWWLRSDIIWSKPNPMPESVTDRPTTAHEHVFLLARSERYFYDAEAVWEADHATDHPRHILHRPEPSGGILPPHNGIRKAEGRNGSGRNLRSVWTIATQPYPEAHFATFPEELARRCIAAGTSERGCCPECGAPWRRVVDVGYENPGNRTTNGPRSIDRRHEEFGSAGYAVRLERRAATTGWASGCAHDRDPIPCTVLDPFAGSGTTLAVARRMGRAGIGIELQPDYLPLIRRRVGREVYQPALELVEAASVSDEPTCTDCGRTEAESPGFVRYLNGPTCLACRTAALTAEGR